MVLNMDETRRKFLILAAAVLLLGIVLFAAVRYHREPSYEGKTLSEWLTSGLYWNDGVPEVEAVAIRAMGTNVIPFLLDWIQYQPRDWNGKVDKFSLRFLGLNFFERHQISEAVRAYNAATAFEVFGSEANPAIPELTRLMETSVGDYIPIHSSLALAKIGPAAFPALLARLTNQPTKVSYRSFFVVEMMGTNAFPVVPIMLQCLTNDDRKAVMSAIMALGKFKLQPDLVVPALTNILTDPQPVLKVVAADALKQFGPEAHIAVPLLQRLLSDSSPHVRKAATNALLKIDPQALTTKAGN